MTAHIKVSGTWKEINSEKVKVSGVWKDVSQGWVKVNGSWKLFHNPSISTSYSGIVSGPTMPFLYMRAFASDGENFYAVKDESPYNKLYKSIGGGPWYLHATMSTGSVINGSYNTSLAYGNGVLVSNSGYYSTDGGTTWNNSPSAIRPTNYNNVYFSNGKFFGSVANTNQGTGGVVSNDGINWTFYSGNAANGTSYLQLFSKIVFTGQKYVCVAGGSISHSTDLVNWTASTGYVPGFGTGQPGFDVNSTGTIVYSDATNNRIVTSTDHGVTFTNQSVAYTPYGVVYANGYWIVLPGTSSRTLKWSTNGTSWTDVANAVPAGELWNNGIAYAKNLGKWMASSGINAVTILSV